MSATTLEPITIPISAAPYAPTIQRRVRVLSYTPDPERGIITLNLRVEHYRVVDSVETDLPAMAYVLSTRSDREKMVNLLGELQEADSETGEYPTGSIPEVDFIWSLFNSGTYTHEQVAAMFLMRMDARGNFNEHGVSFI